MKSYVAVFAFSLALVSATRPEFPTAAKCPNQPVLFPAAPEHVYLVNGKATTQDALHKLQPDAVETIEVVCAIDLHRAFGVESQRGGVSLFTKPGPHSALRADMQRLVALQTAYFEAHGAFAAKLADVSWNDPSGQMTAQLEVTSDGRQWSARGSHRFLLTPSSVVVVSGRAPDR